MVKSASVKKLLITKTEDTFLKAFELPEGWSLKFEEGAVLYTKEGLRFTLDFFKRQRSYSSQAFLRGQTLLKAIGFKNKGCSVLDLTGGWLKDAFLMASFGCKVRALESHPFVFYFVKNQLERLKQTESLIKNESLQQSHRLTDELTKTNQLTKEESNQTEAQRKRPIKRGEHSEISTHFSFPSSLDFQQESKPNEFLLKQSRSSFYLNFVLEDSLNHLKQLKQKPDIIFIDPMFAGRKKSLSPKALRILKELVGETQNKEELFDWALRKAKKKIIVKRHKLDKSLSPHSIASFKGHSLCYDVFSPS